MIKNLAAAAIILSIFTVSCGEEKLFSKWDNNSIIVDGDQTDWQGKLYYLADEQTAIGIANNSDFLSLCLVTNDSKKISQILGTGFTVWIESEQTSEKLGIQYPVNSDEAGRIVQMKNQSMEWENPGIKSRVTELKRNQNEIRLVNENSIPLSVHSLDNNSGIKVAAEFQMGKVIYEMQVPMTKPPFSDHNLSLQPGENITLGFESGEFLKEFSGHLKKSAEFSGAGGRGSGSKGKSGGGNIGRERLQNLEKIDFQVKILLAHNE